MFFLIVWLIIFFGHLFILEKTQKQQPSLLEKEIEIELEINSFGIITILYFL